MTSTKHPTMIWAAIAALLVLLLIVLPMTLYVVDQRELAVVLQFGKPVAERTSPGVYFKLPIVQNVVKLPSTQQFWGDEAHNPLSDLPTKDDKKIEIVPWAVWRVKEPRIFVQTLVTMDEAERRVSEFVRGAIRDVITQYDLAEFVRSTDRPLTMSGTMSVDAANLIGQANDLEEERVVQTQIQFGRPAILEKIQTEARRRLTSKAEGGQGRGIELVDLGISRIEFVESVQKKTFDRWIAERQAIAALNVNQGERMKQEIVNLAKANVERIEGEGQRKANEIRGDVDAEVIRKYATAIQETGDFYRFVRLLEVYEQGITSDTRLILTTDSDLLSLLKHLPPIESSTDARTQPATSTSPLAPSTQSTDSHDASP